MGNCDSNCGGPGINAMRDLANRAAYWARVAQQAAIDAGATGPQGSTGPAGAGGGGATGAGGDAIFWNNGQTVNTSYSIPASTNSGSFGPITVASGVSVTIPTGSVWTVV